MIHHCHKLVLLALATLAPAQTIVVDGAGGGNYREISTALANAKSGAVILVKHYPQGYQPFTITNMSVTIVGYAGLGSLVPPLVNLPGPGSSGVQIGPLRPGDHVIIEGLKFHQSGAISGPPVKITGVRGSANLQWCIFSGASSTTDFHVRIEDSTAVGLTACESRGTLINSNAANHWLFRIHLSQVAFAQCNFAGRDSGSASLPGAPVIDATHSKITIHDSKLIGGSGSSAGNTAGGPAILLRNLSSLFAAGRANQSLLAGGAGGSSTARGGDGVVLNIASSARIEGFAPTAGKGGQPVVADSSSRATVNATSTPPLHQIQATPRPGGNALWSIDVPMGTPLLLIAGFEPTYIDVGFVGPVRLNPVVALPVNSATFMPVFVGAKVPGNIPVGTHLVTQALNLVGGQVWTSDAMISIVR